MVNILTMMVEILTSKGFWLVMRWVAERAIGLWLRTGLGGAGTASNPGKGDDGASLSG
jgi:hypothetical protein